MTQGPSACPGAINSIKAALPNDGRARYANYGKGVLLWHNDAQAACFVNAQAPPITSTDLYWHTDPNEDGRPQDYTSSATAARRLTRMRNLDARDGVRQPQARGFVEVTWPSTQDPG